MAPSSPWFVKWIGWIGGRERWLFRSVNSVMVCLLIYFSWAIGSHLLEHWRQGNVESWLLATVQSKSPADPGNPHAREPLIGDYRVVWERNLFGTSKAAQDAAKAKIAAVEKIAVAEKNLGLRLIGTVVANNPMLNYAIIYVISAREEGLFRAQERAGKAIIQQILRNTVIIQTDTGQLRRLVVEAEPITASSAPAPSPPADYRNRMPEPPPQATTLLPTEVQEKIVPSKFPRPIRPHRTAERGRGQDPE